MNFLKLAAPLALSLSLLAATPAPAFAADDASRFLITPAFIKKMEAVQADSEGHKRITEDEDDSDDGDNSKQTIDSAIKKIEKDPRARAMLAKHGITAREMVLASYAMLHAGMYVAMENSMDKVKGAQLYATYTKEQKANIALMRTYAAKGKK
jgi:hypothetical protein